MGWKDIISLGVPVLTLIISIFALYFSYWHKTAKAILCLNSRFFDPLGGKTNRELNYTFSNIGNQELYVKEIALLRGESPLGHLKHKSSYLEIITDTIKPFVIKPGEIISFTLKHDANYNLPLDYNEELNKYIIVSLEVIYAFGKRYQVTHDISDLGSTGPDIRNKIWKGVPLGKRIR